MKTSPVENSSFKRIRALGWTLEDAMLNLPEIIRKHAESEGVTPDWWCRKVNRDPTFYSQITSRNPREWRLSTAAIFLEAIGPKKRAA